MTTEKLQAASLDIWKQKYQLKTKDGKPIDLNVADTFSRVAKKLASNEKDPDFWESEFYNVLEQGGLLAGRILSNLGAEEYKPNTSTINCTVSGKIEDSIEGILSKLKEAGLTLSRGSGIGYDFSTLRPRGASISGLGAFTSGALSFMDVYDKMCFTISSAGGRRGAQMATFDVSHPDVEEFIKAKREKGRFRQFNLSLLITKEFLEAVENKREWKLIFPVNKGSFDLLTAEIIWKKPKVLNLEIENFNPNNETSKQEYEKNSEGYIAYKVYKTIQAENLWNLITSSTYDYAEPGFILIDEANYLNNNWFCEDIKASNPCGEQLLPPYGSCLLGSVNLTKFVKHPFTPKAYFDFKAYKKLIPIFTRMLDNVVEFNGLPLPEQRNEIYSKRRHGMGYLGLGSALTMLGIPYGSDESIVFTDEVTRLLATLGWETSISLGQEKGVAPILMHKYIITEKSLNEKPELRDLYVEGDIVPGKELHSMSNYFKNFDGELVEKIFTLGARFTHHTSIAPTGTIALSIGNNVSNGIEPSFAHRYFRNVILEGRKTKERVNVYSYELLKYCEVKNLDPDEIDLDTLPEYFSTSEVEPKCHIDIQSAAQKWVDSSISKCVAKGTIFLTNKGLIPIEQLGTVGKKADTFSTITDPTYVISSDTKFDSVTQHYYGGTKPTKKITFNNGNVIEGALTHRLKNNDGSWKALEDVKIGDMFTAYKIKPFDKEGNVDLLNDKTSKNIPTNMTTVLAEFIGLHLAYGFSNKENFEIGIISNDSEVRQSYINLGSILFKTKFTSVTSTEGVLAKVNSSDIQKWLNELTLNGEIIPTSIMIGSLSERRAFLKGLTDKHNVFQLKCDARSTNINNKKRLFRNVASIAYSVGYLTTIDNTTLTLKLSDVSSLSFKYEVAIVSIEDSEAEVYDIEVESSHSYLIDGVLSHNTINIPTDYPYEDFKNVYKYACSKGLKGVTVFRFNPEIFQGVLVKEDDLKNTTYVFTLDDGSKVELRGDEQIEYDCDLHTAANLYDAIKDGYYGKL